MEYVEPELREDNGEIELARQFKLPHLIEQKTLKAIYTAIHFGLTVGIA